MTDPVRAPLLEDDPGPQWRPDVLDGFERRVVAVDDGGQGPNLVTVVRPVRGPAPLPRARRAVVAVHGWSDYFYNAPLARAVEAAGYAFHAVDLRHYGRSLRPGRTPGRVEDLAEHVADLDAALAVVAEDHPVPPVVLAHSTGGLVAALWAHERPGRAAALVLNSPWLEMHGGPPGRALALALARRGRRRPEARLPVPRVDHYWRSLSAAADGEWDLHPQWRPPHAFEVPAVWLGAVAAGHRRVARGLDVRVPVLVHVAGRGRRGLRYGPAMQTADIILSPGATARRARRLGAQVSVLRHPGALHDVFASAPPVRRAAWEQTARWLRAYAPPSP